MKRTRMPLTRPDPNCVQCRGSGWHQVTADRVGRCECTKPQPAARHDGAPPMQDWKSRATGERA